MNICVNNVVTQKSEISLESFEFFYSHFYRVFVCSVCTKCVVEKMHSSQSSTIKLRDDTKKNPLFFWIQQQCSSNSFELRFCSLLKFFQFFPLLSFQLQLEVLCILYFYIFIKRGCIETRR